MTPRRASIHASLLVGLAIFLGSCGSFRGDRPVCEIEVFHTGICHLGKDHVLGAEYSADDRLPFVIYSFLVESPQGEKALVDLGPKTLEYCNAMFRRHGFFRDRGPELPPAERYPDDIAQPYGTVFTQLRERRISPDEIDHIVFTHFHADHHGMDDATNGGASADFENATLHASAIGWRDNLEKRRDGRWASYVDYAFSDFLVEREQQGRVRFEDDATIFPGLRTLHLGGHSICSQAVIVDTRAGPAIIASDDIYLYRLLEEGIVPEIRTSREKYRAAIDRLVDLAVAENGIIVPLHDPIVWKTYRRSRESGDDWLAELKKVSDRAVKGWSATWRRSSRVQ